MSGNYQEEEAEEDPAASATAAPKRKTAAAFESAIATVEDATDKEVKSTKTQSPK